MDKKPLFSMVRWKTYLRAGPIDHKMSFPPLLAAMFSSDGKFQPDPKVHYCRSSDGYINVSEICKAGGKAFGTWNGKSKSKAFLEALGRELKVDVSSLISLQTGHKYDQTIWAHPQVAINVARWVHPKFDVKISRLVMELTATGKVDIDKETSDEELINAWKNGKEGPQK
jgi:hypothetical protein